MTKLYVLCLTTQVGRMPARHSHPTHISQDIVYLYDRKRTKVIRDSCDGLALVLHTSWLVLWGLKTNTIISLYLSLSGQAYLASCNALIGVSPADSLAVLPPRYPLRLRANLLKGDISNYWNCFDTAGWAESGCRVLGLRVRSVRIEIGIPTHLPTA